MEHSENKLALYMHAGSGNHGCEAIVDSLVRSLPGGQITLMSNCAKEDRTYLPEAVQRQLSIFEEQHIGDHFVTHALYYARRKLTGDAESFLRYRYRALTGRGKPDLAVSIGGDNYCYPSMVPDLIQANAMFHHQGTKTMLLGCSIEPELLQGEGSKALLEDLARYDRILARESITYTALKNAGIPKEKLRLVPDPAFLLPKDERALPAGFRSGDTVGINVSPMAQAYAKDGDAVLAAFADLVQHILDTTEMDVALIPHVTWARSDDRVPLSDLYGRFSGNERVRLIPDLPAEQLKGIIANCRYFVGARTHATIAAYSSLVPTLVIGYSVKARGIAEDLFGRSFRYVLPVQDLSQSRQLVDAYDWLSANEDEIRYDLAGAIPLFKARAGQNGEEIRTLLNGS